MSKIKIRLKDYNNTCLSISGSKNSSLPIIVASLLCDDTVTLSNIPRISDVLKMIEILNHLSYKTSFVDNTLTIYGKKKCKWNIKTPIVNELRGSSYFLGALIGKINKVKLKEIGGCKLGNRPINYHIDAFLKMGLCIENNDNHICITGCPNGTTHTLDYPSVGATINIILSTVKNTEKIITTKILNASIEPEVVDLCNFLCSMGANISGIGTSCIKIESVERLYSSNYTIIPDRIEAGTFLLLASLHEGITLTNININHLDSIIKILSCIGCKFKLKNNQITLISSLSKPFFASTNPYPFFPTDLSPQISVVATQIQGSSTIHETVFKNRFSHINELKKLNLNIKLDNNIAIINGKQEINYNGDELECIDLRQSAALIIAASLSKEFITINNIEILNRGYENIFYKLSQLGFEITFIK